MILKFLPLIKKKIKWQTKFNPDDYKRPIKLRTDLVDAKSEKKVLKKGSKINLVIAKKFFSEGLKMFHSLQIFF